jgi:hypothetical protein
MTREQIEAALDAEMQKHVEDRWWRLSAETRYLVGGKEAQAFLSQLWKKQYLYNKLVEAKMKEL